MSGYRGCACRDCFEIAIGEDEATLCNGCEDAGCCADGDEDCLVEPDFGEDEDGSIDPEGQDR